MATSLREGKLNSNLLNSAQKLTLCHILHVYIYIYIYMHEASVLWVWFTRSIAETCLLRILSFLGLQEFWQDPPHVQHSKYFYIFCFVFHIKFPEISALFTLSNEQIIRPNPHKHPRTPLSECWWEINDVKATCNGGSVDKVDANYVIFINVCCFCIYLSVCLSVYLFVYICQSVLSL